MSERPTEAMLAAIIFLVEALINIGFAVMILMAAGGNILLLLFASFAAIFFIILGIFGLIVFFGLWKLRKWGWILALIVSLGTIANSIGLIADLLYSVPLILSVIVLILLILPNTRSAYGM